jgi:hypothetical protein
MYEQQSQITSTIAEIHNEKLKVNMILSFIDLLPPASQATLGYLMRQLKKVCEKMLAI